MMAESAKRQDFYEAKTTGPGRPVMRDAFRGIRLASRKHDTKYCGNKQETTGHEKTREYSSMSPLCWRYILVGTCLVLLTAFNSLLFIRTSHMERRLQRLEQLMIVRDILDDFQHSLLHLNSLSLL